MTLPGPTGGAWALGLLAWAGVVVILGEFVRTLAARRFHSWRTSEPIERLLLDFYLGGGTLFLIAALPIGAFVAPVVIGLPIAAGVGLLLLVALYRRGHSGTEELARSLTALARPAPLLVLLSALALFVIELVVALPVGTGNTFDSGLLTTYTALLLQNHSIPLSFHPYATPSILYPQGATVWLGWAQLLFGLPPARTSLLVTPLFFALAPLGGFVFGRRLFDSDRAGVAMALVLVWLGPGTRGIVDGSNDFVFAFPLVLLLAGQATTWLRSPPPTRADAVAFGLLTGYSGAMNPVGAEWIFVAILVGGLLARPRYGGAAIRWAGRWVLGVAAALVGVIPSLYVLVLGHASPGFVPGAASPPPGYPTGITGAQFVGSVDPFLFRTGDVALSPIPAIRLELAILIVAGLAILLVVGRDSAPGRYLDLFRSFVTGAFAATVALLAVLWSAMTGFGPAVAVASVTSAGEVSAWLFTVYSFVAAVPLVLALERFSDWLRPLPAALPRARLPGIRASRRGATPASNAYRAVVPLAVALVIVLPGVALTPTALPPVLSKIYQNFGNVSAGDFALLQYAGSHLPLGARVLIAPGSAADFLPGYSADLVLLYPLVPGWPWINSSYRVIVNELSNATLQPAGESALSALEVDYVVVTGNNTLLWPAFSPAPLLADPGGFPLLFHDGDAYLFARTGAEGPASRA